MSEEIINEEEEVVLEEEYNEPDEEVEEEEEDQINWKERAMKAEQTLIAQKKKNKEKKNITKQESEDTPDLSREVQNIKANQDKWNFGVENNLEPRVVNELYKTFGRLPTQDELKTPVVQGALAGLKKQFRVTDNTPKGQGNSKPRLINQDFGKLNKTEKQAQFTEYAQKFNK